VTGQSEQGDERTRALQAVSGLIWTVVFAGIAVFAASLLHWLLIDVFPQSTFSRQVLAIAGGALFASLALPRPFGVPRRSGFGLALGPDTGLKALVGLGLGIGLAVFCVGVPWLVGALVFEVQASDAGVWALGVLPGVPSAVVVLIVGAFGEELLLRGYGFQQLSRAITPMGAAVAGGVFFGALHASNPSAAWLSIVNTTLFGTLFGFAVIRYRSLWPSIGMHLGWNLALAILGSPISGLRMGLTALRATPVGGVLWTGGGYGPEASLVVTVAVFAAAIVVWKMPISADNFPLIWDDVRPPKGGSENSCDG
jgi:membrane protease YdiL (CAAX protease family)